MFAGVGEYLKENVDVRVHGENEILIDPHGKVPEDSPKLHGEYGHSAGHHHRDRVTREHDQHGQQCVHAEQEYRLHHWQSLQDSCHGHREQC